MGDKLHPQAPGHLPGFITAPGDTDVLMVVMAIFLVVALLYVGNIYLRLHSLPERLAHKSQKLQFEIVAILGLLALFTHIHLFWIAALLLALIDVPDFGTPLRRIAESVEQIASDGRRSEAPRPEAGPPPPVSVALAESPSPTAPSAEEPRRHA